MGIYKGWIPTVTGRLSFSVFGNTNHPTPAITENVSDGDSRYILSYQERVLLDTILPLKKYLAKPLLKLEGRFWFVCIGRSSNDPTVVDDSLCGRLFIFVGKDGWQGSPKDAVHSYQEKLKAFRDPNIRDRLDSYFSDDYEAASNELTRLCSFYANFRLARDGESQLFPQTSKDLSELSKSSLNKPAKDKYHEHIVCSQQFFFLRDLAHRHQHHCPHTDTVVDLHHAGDDDFQWRSETLRSLYRKILQFKRTRSERTFSSSLGILAYANAFRKISVNTLSERDNSVFIQNNKELPPSMLDSSLEQSIAAAQEIERNETQDNIKKHEIIRTTLFSSLLAVFSLVGLLKLTDTNIDAKPSGLLVFAAYSIVENTLSSIAVLVGLLVALLVYARVVDITEWSTVRGLTRLIQALKKRYSLGIVFVLFLLSTSLLGFFLYL